MRVFIFPSFSEGLGTALVEAQIGGIHCVISDKIPREAILVPRLVTIKKIDDSLDEWVDGVWALSGCQGGLTQDEDKEITLSQYNIKSSTKSLNQHYRRLIDKNPSNFGP